MKNYNVSPYFDDFDESNDFYQIMFKPGMAVQARELTQIQSILRSQIEKFGNHIFKHGSIVIPGNSQAELNTPYLKVSGLSGASLNLAMFKDKVIVGETSGVKAIVKIAAERTETDPYVLYVVYISGGNTGQISFEQDEIIHLEIDNQIRAVIGSGISALGIGSIAHVNTGVYYVNGTFAHVEKQSVIIDKFSSSPSAKVVLKINEKIVTYNEDESLLDPSQGSFNYAAPGADRIQITLVLAVLDVNAEDSSDYIELMRYREGILEEHARYPKYSELEKSLARRTYDESGNYIVEGLRFSVRENKKLKNNNGYSISGDVDKLTYQLSKGKAYFKGFELINEYTRNFVVDKARTSSHVLQTSTTVKPSYGQYILVSNPSGRLDTDTMESVQLWTDSDASGGTQIGTARAVAFDYYTGDGTNPIFKIFFSDINLTSGSYEDIGSVRTATPFHARVVAECVAPLSSGSLVVNEIVNFNAGTRSATVALYNTLEGILWIHRHDSSKAVPKIGDLIIGATGGASVVIKQKKIIQVNGQSGSVFRLSSSATKSLKNSLNSYDMNFVANRKLSIASSATSVSISGGTFVAIETGTFVALTSSGVDPISNYTINGSGTVITRNSPAPVGGVTIYAQVNTIGNPRTKNIQTSSPIVKTSTRSIVLNHADVFEIISVLSGSIDIKNYYTLEKGITDYEYGLSSIKLKDGITLPAGNVTVTYKYYSHTAGDFFSVDSYNGVNIADIPTHVSTVTGETFSLRDCIDFRKTVGVPFNIVVSDTIIQTSIQRYMSRVDSICLNKQMELIVVDGIPGENPKSPSVSSELYELCQVFIPAYTFNIKDVKTRGVAVNRYTMSQIGKIEKRIDRLEEYTTLSIQEAKLLKTEVIDASTGLDRYKTGYIVEDMTDPFGLANVFNESFKSTMNPNEGILPLLEQTPISLDVLSYSGMKNTGGMLTLNYTEKKFADVNVSSRITNLNPFLVISWIGRLLLTPPEDIWTEVIDRPDVIINRTENVIIQNIIWVNPPAAPPRETPFPVPIIPTQPPAPIVTPPVGTPPTAVTGPTIASAPVAFTVFYDSSINTYGPVSQSASTIWDSGTVWYPAGTTSPAQITNSDMFA